MAVAPPHPPLHKQPPLLRRMFSDPQPVLEELRADYGPVVGLGFGPAKMAIVGGPAEVQSLFTRPVDDFRWNHKFNALAVVVGSESMITSDGDDWARRRASVQSAFSRRRLNGWIPMILEQADAAVDSLPADGSPQVIDLYRVGRAAILEIVVRAFFGATMADQATRIGDLMQRPQDYLEMPAWKQIPHPFAFGKRGQVRADRRAFDELVREAIADIADNPSRDPDDVLDVLVGEGSLSEKEVLDQVNTLVGAGFDTTAASLAWMLWCCGLDPEVWASLRAEADAVLGAPDDAQVFDHTTLSRLEYAARVVRESLRLHPAGVISPREAARDLEIAGHTITKGTLILWSAHLAGRDPDVWKDPLRFDPDRFIDMPEDQRAAADAAWIPFGGGRRNCIGFALAQMELTLLISRLAQRLDVTPPSGGKPRPVGMVVNRPKGGVPFHVSRRTLDDTTMAEHAGGSPT